MTPARSSRSSEWAARLTQRLSEIAASVQTRPGALALLGVGSCGLHSVRIDEFSDLDFFVIVETEAQAQFLGDIDWLRAAAPTAYDFQNSPHGRKVLFQDGVFAEYAVFTRQEWAAVAEPSMRVLWSRDPSQNWVTHQTSQVPAGWGHNQPDHHLGEALTNLYVGLLRELRGERLTALRFIQVYAVDRVLTIQALRLEAGPPRDPYAVDRRAEQWAGPVPLAKFCPGYEQNREAASAILTWLAEHEAPGPVMVGAVQQLLDGALPATLRLDEPVGGVP
ncbi:hypothetical protein K7W42_20800 [Deinococcus sp. HMF7604]|uniref:hypothetical protein n=1 Tax=Deinococcus betulae TaxID=2873312 RepID=UPI001CCC17FD|nr:hypothetical protein [Deinococcus betulae]MBZ9753280.1 hypothetical protein [Deinococcus betulae]